ncbi:hypothetical protein GCM10020220_062000 [Nonomuraea rubra]|uniref:LLM class flavin-dependent oxidoreductase n=1 Tax=Nonomuraea rubra TaxID=46180 RepID=UPI0031EBCD0B
MVRYAIGLPNVGEFGDPALLTELAVAAEEHGWDGVYLWDHLLYHDPAWPVANPTVTLSAIAARTHRIRLGILMTALPRRRVQTVAKETATLDRLSAGRLVFGAGLGSMDTEYTDFGEDPDLKTRAAKLDHGLYDLTHLWQRLLPPPRPATPHPHLVPGTLAHPRRLPPRRPMGRRHAHLPPVRPGPPRPPRQSSPRSSTTSPNNAAPSTATTSPSKAAPPTASSTPTPEPA